MITVTPKESKALAKLKIEAKRHGVTHDHIAAAAGVTRPLVVNVFALRSKSQNVLDTTRRLIADAKARNGAEAVAS